MTGMIGRMAASAGRGLARGFRAMPPKLRLAVAAVAVGGPVLAYSIAGFDGPRGGASGGGDAVAASHGFYRSPASALPVDVEGLYEEIAWARDGAEPGDATRYSFAEALEAIDERVATASGGWLPDAIRDRDAGADVLVGHATALLAGRDVWGAAGNLLVAHERDPDAPAPLLGLAAIANGQGMPGVALALSEAAAARVDDDAADAGARLAAAANNRGHALLLLGEWDEAESALRDALRRDPELSEAARNLVHVLVRQGKEDEARRLLPRAAYRLPARRGGPREVEVRAPESATPEAPEVPTGSPEQVAQWQQSPWLEGQDGQLRLPLWIALDLSRRGQVAWPEVMFPRGDASYIDYATAAMQRAMEGQQSSQALMMQSFAALAATRARVGTRADHVYGTIASMVPAEWTVHPVDLDLFPMPESEPLILAGGERTRFQALSVARAEHHMEQKAAELGKRVEAFACRSEDYEACCAEQRAMTYRHVGELLPFARDYEEHMRVFFGEAYGLTSAIASNLPRGPYLEDARANLEAKALDHYVRAQTEIVAAFEAGAPRFGLCLDEGQPAAAGPEVKADVPACDEGSQDYSGKWSLGSAFSVEATCGKVKFVAELDVLGTGDTRWGGDLPFEASLGMHAEAEFAIDGTITVFAGPKAGVAAELGGVGGDFGVKDGIYAVIGSDGVRDVGMRVVLGGGAKGGQGGVTHDTDSMDFSFVSAI